MKLIINEGTKDFDAEYESMQDVIKKINDAMDENVTEVKITKKEGEQKNKVLQLYDSDGNLLAESEPFSGKKKKVYYYNHPTEEEILKLLDEETPVDAQTATACSGLLDGLVKSLIVGNGLKWYQEKGSTATLILALLYGKSALQSSPDLSAEFQENARQIRDFCRRYFDPK